VPRHEVAFILAASRLIEPSSELAIEEHLYPRTALDDIVGVPAEKVNKDRLYRGLDRLQLPDPCATPTPPRSRSSRFRAALLPLLPLPGLQPSMSANRPHRLR